MAKQLWIFHTAKLKCPLPPGHIHDSHHMCFNGLQLVSARCPPCADGMDVALCSPRMMFHVTPEKKLDVPAMAFH